MMYKYTGEPSNYSFLVEKGITDETGKRIITEEIKPPKNNKVSIFGVKYVSSGSCERDVWVSNLQKCVRKGLIEEACKSVVELINTGLEYNSRNIVTNVINRLKIIVSEDIGPASLVAPSLFLEFTKDHTNNLKVSILKLTRRLCLLHKSRLTDNTYIYLRLLYKEKLKVRTGFDSDFERFKHFFNLIKSKTIKSLRINVINCVCIACRIEKSKAQMTDRIECKGRESTLLRNRRKNVYKVWKYILDNCDDEVYEANLNLLELYVKGPNLLFLINAIYNVVIDCLGWLQEENNFDDDNIDFLVEWDVLQKKVIHPRPEAYDKHTSLGSTLDAGIHHFFKHGALLANTVDNFEPLESFFYKKCLELTSNQ